MSIINYCSKLDFLELKKSGSISSSILDYINFYIKPGINTNFINILCHNKIISLGCVPACLNYNCFPNSICSSVNNVVCHGIPDNLYLIEGDIVNIDITIIYSRWYSDTSRMYIIGNIINFFYVKLINTTYNSLLKSISILKNGVFLNKIGYIIQKYVFNFNYSIIKDYCGHGIGKRFHLLPNIMHYKNCFKHYIKLKKVYN